MEKCNCRCNNSDSDFRELSETHGRDIVKNKAFLEIEVCGGKHKIESNEVRAQKIDVRMHKFQSCDFVVKGSIEEYTVKICNDSDVDLFNVEFKDIIDEQEEFVDNDFEIIGAEGKFEKHGRVLECHIEKLRAKKEALIKFKAKVL